MGLQLQSTKNWLFDDDSSEDGKQEIIVPYCLHLLPKSKYIMDCVTAFYHAEKRMGSEVEKNDAYHDLRPQFLQGGGTINRTAACGLKEFVKKEMKKKVYLLLPLLSSHLR
jgi:hypothetical protein